MWLSVRVRCRVRERVRVAVTVMVTVRVTVSVRFWGRMVRVCSGAVVGCGIQIGTSQQWPSSPAVTSVS